MNGLSDRNARVSGFRMFSLTPVVCCLTASSLPSPGSLEVTTDVLAFRANMSPSVVVRRPRPGSSGARRLCPVSAPGFVETPLRALHCPVLPCPRPGCGKVGLYSVPRSGLPQPQNTWASQRGSEMGRKGEKSPHWLVSVFTSPSWAAGGRGLSYLLRSSPCA